MTYAKSSPQSRNNLLARLHCIKKTQAWSDDEYRDILQSRTGKRSAADLSGPELARAVANIGSQYRDGSATRSPRQPHEWSWVDTAAAHKRPLLKKIIMLMKGTSIKRGDQVAYVEGIAKQINGLNTTSGPITKPLTMCDEGELWRIVQAVAVHIRRHGFNPNDVTG